MSRSVDIDFPFIESISFSPFIRTLVDAGMQASSGGEISYLIDEDGMFDWRKGDSFQLGDIISTVGNERWNERTVGITLYFPDSDTRGDFLFHPGREVVSCVLGVNPKILAGSVFCDIGWYLSKLIPLLEPLGLTEVETRDSP